MTVMRDLDPQGTAARAQHKIIRRVYTSKVFNFFCSCSIRLMTINTVLQGPNFAWHIDQYDKLCAFGFKIHGCIDGYVTITLITSPN